MYKCACVCVFVQHPDRHLRKQIVAARHIRTIAPFMRGPFRSTSPGEGAARRQQPIIIAVLHTPCAAVSQGAAVSQES
jgi:hypothetical protein